ncbi:hypothetical protein ACMXYW_14940 [Neptuniibacter sp. QD48_55]|uniref:hypothetical protein n=1 Tax=Neptuniibacter sp. QD48_55 TaxID=3398212 RepID=UPI0039F5D073
MSRFLSTLLQRSDYLAVECGKIILIPANGDTTTSDTWLKEHWLRVASELLRVTGHSGYIYKGYSTGFYTGHKAGGVTLQLFNPVNNQTAFAIFNAELKRARSTKYGKKGSALPKGRFIAGKKSGFVQFWCDMGLGLPKRLSAFHDCMGKLDGLLMTAITNEKNKVINRSLMPLTIKHQELKELIKVPDNYPTIIPQTTDKQLTRIPDKEFHQSPVSHGVQPTSAACLNNYDIKVKGITGEGNSSLRLINNKPPQDQTIDEWLDDYTSNESQLASTNNTSRKPIPKCWQDLKGALNQSD